MILVKDLFKVSAGKLTNKSIGFELEVEGENLPYEVRGYNTTHDGSLKGEGREYVFCNPLTLTGAKTSIKRLCKELKENSVVYDTGRAGTHVHINVQDLTMHQLFNFITIYCVLEEVLTSYCGENREGNHFCLRMVDAQAHVNFIRKALRSRVNLRRQLQTDALRYSALNLQSLFSFGSLEFRSMRSTIDTGVLTNWVDMLYGLRSTAMEYPNPIEVISSFSEGGEEAFIRNCLGDHADWFYENIPDIGERLHSGMRVAQDIAYAINWEEDYFDPRDEGKEGGVPHIIRRELIADF